MIDNIINDDFLTSARLNLERIKDGAAKYSVIEQSEIFEVAGICQYFNGQYREAMVNLELSIKGQYESLKPQRQLCYIKILLAGVHFRFGNLDRAESNLKDAHSLALKFKNIEYISIALSNLAIVNLRQRKYQAAIKNSRDSVEFVLENYSKTSSEYINHSRILLSIYLKSGELTKAEVLLTENIFPEREQSLLSAGLKYISGQQAQSLSILTNYGISSTIGSVQRFPSKSALQTTFEDFNFSEDSILQALARKNYFYTVIDDNNDKSATEASSVMRACLERVIQKRSNDGDDESFLNCDWDKYPDFAPFDVYLYPVVVLASMLLTKAESMLQSTQFLSGPLIQSGVVNLGNEVQQTMEDIHAYFNDALEVLYQAAPHYRKLNITSSLDLSETPMEDSIDSSKVYEERVTLDSWMRQVEHNDSHDVPDVSILKESMLNFIHLNKVNNGENDDLKAAASAASKILKSNYDISLSSKTGEVQQIPEAYFKGGSYQVSNSSKSSNKQRLFNEKSVYKAVAHDQSSIMAEVTPILELFGRDDISAWIQWALSLSAGMSMGVLCLPCPNPLPEEGFAMDKIKKRLPNEAFLKEVRSRLVMLDGKLVADLEQEDDDDGNDDSNPRPSASFNMLSKVKKLESRIIISILLLKVSVQLNLKRESSIHLNEVTSICEKLVVQSQTRETVFYSTITARLKIDYEEWSLPSNVPEDGKFTFNMTTMLPLAKQYLSSANKLGDINLRKDAYKKIINIYSALGGRVSGETKDMEALTEDVSRLSPAEIDALEVANPAWLKRYARLRALAFFKQMKAAQEALGL